MPRLLESVNSLGPNEAGMGQNTLDGVAVVIPQSPPSVVSFDPFEKLFSRDPVLTPHPPEKAVRFGINRRRQRPPRPLRP